MSNDDLVLMVVDQDACIGGGQCELLEPQVFVVGEDEPISSVIGDRTLPRGRSEVVIERCPGMAVSATDVGDDGD